MPEPDRPFFERDVKALVEAFKAGLVFDPPAMSAKEYRENLRSLNLILSDPDDLPLPKFNFAAPVDDFEPDEDDTPEGDDDGYDPTA